VAGLLAFAAGTVDACTVLALFGLYVAQVTGSFVLVGLQIVNADVINVIRTLAIPVFFLAGFATVFLAEMAGNAGRALVWTLLAELALVAGLVAVGIAASPFDHPNAPWALLASVLGVSAMGVQSALVRLLLHDTVSTNVMTTNTTLAAIELAQWTIASRRLAKNPTDAAALEALRHARRRFSGLWPVLAGFLAGACCGAIGFERFGFRLALLPLAVLAGILVWALRRKTPN
jgi:uncharacterized membrane protein YoaK (UPF0700 family)